MTEATSEAKFRAAEARYWRHVGVHPREEWHSLDRTGVRVRVQIVGEGEGPPLLFLHGVNTSGAVWAPLVARLQGFRCLVLDRPGCGLSQKLPTRIDDVAAFAALADDMTADVLDALDIDRAHLMSTSLGGYHAFRTAAAHPDRVSGLVEMGWTVGAPNGYLPLVMRVGGVRSLGRLMARAPAPEAAVRPMLARIGLRQALAAGRVPPELVSWFHALLRHTDTMRNELDGSPPIIRPVRGMNDSILLPDDVLAAVKAPVRFIWGDGDPFGDLAVAEAFAAKVPEADLVVMANAGHAVWIDDPEAVAAATTAFLSATR